MVFELKQEFYSDIFLIQVHQSNFDIWRCSIMEDKYISTKLFINGSWVNSIKNETIECIGPEVLSFKEILNKILKSINLGFKYD